MADSGEFVPGEQTWTFLVGGEGREVGLSDLLDGKHTGAYRPSPLGPRDGSQGTPQRPPEGSLRAFPGLPVSAYYDDVLDLSRAIAHAVTSASFAVLLNPITRMKLQQEYMDIFGADPDDIPNHLHGLLMQAATFIDEGRYALVTREEYDSLRARTSIA